MPRAVLDDGMCDPGLAVVVPVGHVVDTAEKMVGITRFEDLKHPVPVFDFETRSHLWIEKIVFVCNRPPDIVERSHACCDVTDVCIVMICVHRRETEMVVRMEEDDVGLNPHLLEFGNASLHRLKEAWIETVKIELPWAHLHVGI